ncbi:MAG TPA: GNAT family N-acetyltransferase [Bacillota bacterium]|nr:GNAT family N-acetyltransferase [Bacillota bacterium]
MIKEPLNTVLKILSEKWQHDLTHIDGQTLLLLDETQFLRFSVFGNAAVIWANTEIFAWAKENFSNTKAIDLASGNNIYLVEKKLREYGMKLAGEHIRFFRSKASAVSPPTINLQYKIFAVNEISILQQNSGFNHALNYDQDVLAVVAYDGDKIAAVAGADDCMEPMWQIGIDTLPEYRGYGIASYLVSRLADEIEAKGKIAFYTTWSSNITSMRTALAAGFQPFYTEYFAVNLTKEE